MPKLPSSPGNHVIPPEILDELFREPALMANNSVVTIGNFGVRIIFLEEINGASAKHVRCAVMMTHESALGMAKAIVDTLENGNYGNRNGASN